MNRDSTGEGTPARTSMPARVRRLMARLETPGHWLNAGRLQFYSKGALICYAAWIAIYFYKAVWLRHEYINPLALDFLPFWSSSYLALHGHAVDAYNLSILEKIESNAISHPVGILPWLYPPSYLLFVYPFALLPWRIAAAAFLFGTYALFVKAMHSIVRRREAILVAVAFPGAALVMAAGQNGLLTASLAALGLVLLPRRPVAAGVFFGLLCMKPQLAVLFPFALACSGSWRALASLALTAGSMLAVSVIAFGTDTLAAFIHNMGMAAGYVEAGQAALARIPTVFSLVTFAGAPTGFAYAGQAASAIFSAAAVFHAWRAESSYPLRAATLACASLMVSPYLYDYDLAWYGVIIAWYCKHVIDHGWRTGEREWLVLLWMMPFAGVLLVKHAHFQFMPLVSAFTLGMLARRIAVERRNRTANACAATVERDEGHAPASAAS
jgi:hypothetical protein